MSRSCLVEHIQHELHEVEGAIAVEMLVHALLNRSQLLRALQHLSNKFNVSARTVKHLTSSMRHPN